MAPSDRGTVRASFVIFDYTPRSDKARAELAGRPCAGLLQERTHAVANEFRHVVPGLGCRWPPESSGHTGSW
jgi:hypothetical protein